MSFYRDIDDVVQAIKRAKSNGNNINFLIGAGCSVSANIPAANGIIEEIKKQYPGEYERTKEKTYANCMSKLSAPERRKLIIDSVNNAKINWAHIAMAQLMKKNYVNRILTTNFDNLIHRSCSLVGEFPAIYDLATSTSFRSDLLFNKSVLHLHGQHTGFILCNTETEIEEQAEKLTSVFNELNNQSMWVIIGYSGENDAIFELLKKEPTFENRLFIVGFRNQLPTDKYKELLDEKKYAFYVKGYDADDFLVGLSQKLECFPPHFISKPFTYINDSLQNIMPYKLMASNITKEEDFKNESLYRAVSDLTETTKEVINKAIDEIENDDILMAGHYYMSGLHNEVVVNFSDSEQPSVKRWVALSHNELENYQAALEIMNQIDLDEVPEIKNEIYLDIIGVKTKIGFKEIKNNERDVREYILEISGLYYDLLQNRHDKDYFAIISWLIFLYSNLGGISGLSQETIDVIGSHIEFLIELEVNEEEENSIFLFKRSLTYSLIKNGILFDLTKTILDKMYELRSNDPIVLANLGFWYFNNNKISEEEALKNGENLYFLATEQVKDNDDFIIALKQKKLFEKSKLLLSKNKIHDAIEYGKQAQNIGEIKDYEYVLDEGNVIINKINEALEAAATTEDSEA